MLMFCVPNNRKSHNIFKLQRWTQLIRNLTHLKAAYCLLLSKKNFFYYCFAGNDISSLVIWTSEASYMDLPIVVQNVQPLFRSYMDIKSDHSNTNVGKIQKKMLNVYYECIINNTSSSLHSRPVIFGWMTT